MALQIDSSGILLLQQVDSDVQYKSVDDSIWTTISVWPVELSNTGTNLEVQFITDLSFNSADQYFIFDSSNITVDGSNHIVNINISGNGYPGLFQNGTYYYNGNTIDASNNANSNITIQNIIIDSHSSSLLAIAIQTSTRYNYSKYGNGWLCQAYYGLNGSTNSIDNCSSNGPTNTVYWVASNGDVSNNNTGTTNGGCILGDYCSADVTNCYSTGPIGSGAGGIFGSDSQGSATNCYSIGTTIGINAGGIFGPFSSGSATNCYSTGTIGSQAGGIFGLYSSGSASASNCYSTGPIGSQAGGIFGQSSQGSATNCYSIGDIGSTAGGIFGQSSSGSATNCYCTGGTNIGVSDPSYCYSIDGSANWLDASANAALDVSGTIVWTDIDTNSTNVPYRLTSFLNQQTLYTPSSDSDVFVVNSVLADPTAYTWSITSVNGSTSGNPDISIDASGTIRFVDTLPASTYEVNVLATDQFGNYAFEAFTNTLTTTVIDASGDLSIRQQNGATEYSTDNGQTWTQVTTWPVTLNNSGSFAPGVRAGGTPLIITFTDDLSYNLATQYFVLGTDDIIIDGSNHIVTIDVSSNDYPGLFQNGTADTSGNSYITIRNLGVVSSYSVAQNGGWIGQQYFGNDASENYVENCYSTGTIGVYAGGILGESSSGSATNCYSIGEISGYAAGGIFGSSSSGSATNCYSTGEIILAGGGIFGYSSQAGSATNCYSTGPIRSNGGGIFGFSSAGSAINCYSIGTTIGINAGGIFGPSSSGSATNCYSIGDIGVNAGGIFGLGSQGSATNCYSTGDIGNFAGGIFGQNSQGSATNCYSTGDIGGQAGGIFGQSSFVTSATNCYCTGGTNIGVADPSYCYAIDGSANWLDSAADASLNVSEPNAWTDIDTNSENVPYRLTSFYINQTLYDPSSGTNVVTEYPDLSGNYTWSITSVNGSTSGQTGIIIDASNGDISFTSLSAASYAVNVLAEDSFGNYSFETFTNIISNICFPAGTPIVTNQGIIAIHKINPAIHTIRNKKIVAITKTVSPDKYLVRFEKDALGQNLPCEATTMTKNHMLFYKGKMIKAKEFLNTHNESVSKVPYKGTVLYNVLMEEHDKMVVNNLICETLHPENYVAKMHHAFKILTPKQRVELIQQVNKAILTEDIYKKPTSKRFTFTVSK